MGPAAHVERATNMVMNILVGSTAGDQIWKGQCDLPSLPCQNCTSAWLTAVNPFIEDSLAVLVVCVVQK